MNIKIEAKNTGMDVDLTGKGLGMGKRYAITVTQLDALGIATDKTWQSQLDLPDNADITKDNTQIKDHIAYYTSLLQKEVSDQTKEQSLSDVLTTEIQSSINK